MARRILRSRSVAALSALAVGLGLSLGASHSRGDDNGKAQKIAEIEKQIEALSKQLQELRSAPAEKPGPAAGGAVPAEWIKALTWRSIGPAAMGGRITAIAAAETDPTTFWVATASGGLVKTVNNGISFEHQFDHEGTVSIGDVCVAPSDKNIVWVGTGEANPRNSVSYGDGVYKSTDGGKSWKHMGLKKSFQIGRIKIHPKDPNIVYVGALGRLYGPNEERGLFKTTDGGQTWQKVLYVDDRTGVIDIAMHPTEPDTLLVAMWERQRDEFDDFLGEPPPPEGIEQYDPVHKYGKGAGIYKTTDGGKTFHRLSNGLPTAQMGRIGLDYYLKNPNVVFAVIDTEKIGVGEPPPTVSLGALAAESPTGLKVNEVARRGGAARAGLKVDDVITSVDGKPVKSSADLVPILRSHKSGDKVKVTYERGKDKKEVQLALGPPSGGGPRMPNMGFFAEDAVGGVIVSTMVEDGPAHKAGLQWDDLIVAIDGEPVKHFLPTLGKLMGTKRPGDKVKLTVQRGEEKKEILVPLELGGMEARAVRKPIPGRLKRPNSLGLGSQRENVQDSQGPEGVQTGGVYKSTDGGETWTRINSVNPRPMYFSVVRVDPTDENYVWLCGISLYRSKDGGRNFSTQDVNKGVHSDQHALWIDPHNGRHLICGCDGGFYQTYDRGERWDHLNTLALGQFYSVVVDPRPLYRVYGGLQDNGSWAGPAQTLRSYGPVNEDWIIIGGGDGFVCRVDPTNPDLVYAESQGGMIQRRNLKTGERAFVRPLRVPGQPEHRFNWNTPYILSHVNPSVVYVAGEYVWRSMQRGDNLKAISPEITRTKHGSATALAESPMNPDVLYAGTDDGNLWVTRDGGAHWEEVSGKVGLPGPRWVASIEPSRFAEGRCYVAFDAHRSNDDEPYLFVSEDYGQTWKPIRGNLPTGSSRVLREDIQDQNLLYAGTEFAAWVSADRGASWTKLNNNLPTVAVHEFAQHPTSGEIVAATHGRSLWVLDVTPLRAVTADVLKSAAHLFKPNAVVKWKMEEGRDPWFSDSARRFVGQNPPRAAEIYYSLGKKAGSLSLKVLDHTGKQVATLTGKSDPGLHRVAWTLSQGPRRGRGMAFGRGGPRGGEPSAAEGSGGESAKPESTPEAKPEAKTSTAAPAQTPPGGQKPSGPQMAGAMKAEGAPSEEEEPEGPPPEMASFFGFRGPPQVDPGDYRVVLTVDGKEYSQWIRVEPDPSRPAPAVTSGGGEEEP